MMIRPRKPLAATFILHKTRKDRLESVTELNAWGQDVDDVSILSQTPNITLVALACNCLKSLRQFSQCQQLQQLLLRKNEVSDIQELRYLAQLQHLRTLTLSENPVAEAIDYRYKVLAVLPFLTKLDDKAVSPDEIEEAQAQFPDLLLSFTTCDDALTSQTPEPASVSQMPSLTPGASRRTSAADGLPAGTPPVGKFSGPRRSLQLSDWGLDHPQQPQQQQARGQQQQLGSPQLLTPSGPPVVRTPQKHRTFSADGGVGGSGVALQSPQIQYHHQSGLPASQRPQRLSFDSGRAPPEDAFPSAVPHQRQESATKHIQQQQTRASPQQSPALEGPKSGSGGTADNVFYAVVALLPELSLKHLQWARDEIDARMLELQQDNLK